MKFAIGVGLRGLASSSDPKVDMVRYVQAAEAAGVDYAWSAESWGRDAVTSIAYLAAKTTRITLGTGIMQVTARTPVMTAMTALSLSELSDGRFALGLGVSGPQVVEGLHGVPFNPALTRLKENVAIIRQAIAGERIEFEGKVYELPRKGGQGKALKLDHKHRPDLPIYLATLGSRSLQYTGEAADGWLGTSFSPDSPDALLGPIKQGAKAAGRTLDEIDLQASATVCVTDKVDEVVHSLKPGIAFQLGAMGSAQTNFYNAAFSRAGFVDDAKAVQRLWLDRKRDEAARRVPDALVHHYAMVGSEQHVRERLAIYRGAGITTINVRFPPMQAGERIPQLERALDTLRST